jgi:glycosyltransferase involved in cell wall biosynthesis
MTDNATVGAAPLVSVVLPCLNEARGVGKCVEKALAALRQMQISGEVIVVDNGSTDGSADVATNAGARVVREKRRGYGSAYLRGFQEARGQYLIMGDADDTYDFRDIARFIEPLQRDGFDMVMGSRLKGTILPGAMPWTHRWIGNPILSGILKLFFHTTISDSHCGMRSFTRQAYERMHLRTYGMEFASEIVVNALREKFRIHEVPITYYPREGESKLNSLSDAWRHLRFMLVFSPSYLFQLPGMALMVSGGLLILWLAGGPRELFGHEWDFHVLLFGALSLILGYDFVLFDVFAKMFSMGAGLARPDRWLRTLMKFFSLERGVVAGTALFFAGLGLELKITLDWMRTGYGTLMAIRGITIGMTAMVLGAQTVFASFLISLLRIERR